MVTSFIKNYALLVFFIANLNDVVFCSDSNLKKEIKYDEYQVTIYRDIWGVPHIYGNKDKDTAYGLGYAHAEDDFQTIQNILIAARGKLASYYGKEAAPNDYMVKLLGIWAVSYTHLTLPTIYSV